MNNEVLKKITSKALDRISLTNKPPKIKIKTAFEKAFKKYLSEKGIFLVKGD